MKVFDDEGASPAPLDPATAHEQLIAILTRIANAIELLAPEGR